MHHRGYSLLPLGWQQVYGFCFHRQLAPKAPFLQAKSSKLYAMDIKSIHLIT
jgi:hypothetical protein